MKKFIFPILVLAVLLWCSSAALGKGKGKDKSHTKSGKTVEISKKTQSKKKDTAAGKKLESPKKTKGKKISEKGKKWHGSELLDSQVQRFTVLG